MKLKKIISICIICSVVFSGSICILNKNAEKTEAASIQNNVNTEKESDAEKSHKLYGIGSVSKVYTAAAVMKLVDEEKVHLDSPVVNYIPEFKMADERYKNITVRMLLNHSSGLNGGTNCNSILLGDNSTYNHDNFLENLKDQKLKAEPGEYSVYCNDGFTLAEILVEKVSHMSFTDYLEKEICTPLGLRNTKTPQSSMDESDLAKIYFNGSSLELPRECPNVIGAGGIYADAEDVCRFSQIFMKNGSFLSPKLKEAMSQCESDKDLYGVTNKDGAIKYGLGWDSVNTYPFNKYNIRAFSKGGDTDFYHGNMLVIPDYNIGVCVLSSGGDSKSDALAAQEICEALLKAEGIIKEESKYESFKCDNAGKIPEELKSNEGIYCSDQMLKVSFKDNKMLISTIDSEKNVTQEYVYDQNGYFVSTNGQYINSGGLVSSENGTIGSSRIYFKKESNGENYMFTESLSSMAGLSHDACAMPYAQKIQENNISEKILNAWKNRNKKRYYLTSEKYTSAGYLLKSNAMIKIELSSAVQGYVKNNELYKCCRIIDENYCEDFVKIPSMIGRDTNDFSFSKEGNTEYLSLPAQKKKFICEDAIKEININEGRVVMNDDNAKWFKIGSKDAQKQVTIDIKGKGAYFVYDKYDNCLNTSEIKNNSKKILLPKEGKIAFAGENKTAFIIK